MAEEKRTCETCIHNYLGPGYEPCKSCSDDCSNWDASLVVLPVQDRALDLNEELSTEPVLYKYFVHYSYEKDGVRYDRGSILNSERLTHSVNIEKLQLALEQINGFDDVCLLDWKELED